VGILLQPLHQVGGGNPMIKIGRRAAFQFGQGQQVADQTLHPAGLRFHEPQVLLLLGLVKFQRLQRLHKTRQHGQRRADFMRHIGDKIAPHRFGLLQRGDIARQQQRTPFAIRMQLHRQAHRSPG